MPVFLFKTYNPSIADESLWNWQVQSCALSQPASGPSEPSLRPACPASLTSFSTPAIKSLPAHGGLSVTCRELWMHMCVSLWGECANVRAKGKNW